jgi:hypothetical protein
MSNPEMKYPLPQLNALADGAVLDARFRVALQLLLSPNFVSGFVEIEDATHEGRTFAAQHAVNVAMLAAEGLFAAGEMRGWVAPLAMTNELPLVERLHVERNAAAQVFAQLFAQTIAQGQSSPLAGMRSINGQPV